MGSFLPVLCPVGWKHKVYKAPGRWMIMTINSWGGNWLKLNSVREMLSLQKKPGINVAVFSLKGAKAVIGIFCVLRNCRSTDFKALNL